MPSLDPFEDNPSRPAKAAGAADNIEVAPGLQLSRPTIDPRVNSSWSALEAAGLLPKKDIDTTSDAGSDVDQDGWPTETTPSGTVRVTPPPPPPPPPSARPAGRTRGAVPEQVRVSDPAVAAVTSAAPPPAASLQPASSLATDAARVTLVPPAPEPAQRSAAPPPGQSPGQAAASGQSPPGQSPGQAAASAAPPPYQSPPAQVAAPGQAADSSATQAVSVTAAAVATPTILASAAPAAIGASTATAATAATTTALRPRSIGRPPGTANPAALVRGPRVVGRTVGRRQLFGRRPRVRKVSRVVRRIDGWTVFKISLVLYALLYVILVIAGVLLWHLAYTTGTVDNIQGFIKELFGLKTFVIDGKKLFQASRTLGLVLAIGGTGLHVTLAVLFNLIADLVGGVRVTVLEEEVILRDRDRDTAPTQSD